MDVDFVDVNWTVAVASVVVIEAAVATVDDDGEEENVAASSLVSFQERWGVPEMNNDLAPEVLVYSETNEKDNCNMNL